MMNQNNTARDLTREERLRLIDISVSRNLEPDPYGREWHFINLEDFEFQIRQEELRKYMALRKKERNRKRWYREAKVDLFKATLIPRVCGLMMIAMTVSTLFLLRAIGEVAVDGTWMLVTLGIGILLVTMPGNNKPKK